ncbi:MAG: phosphotransferase, partial [Bacteroidales bacterium]
EYFVRVEDGPEGDEYMEVESKVMESVRLLGVPTPIVYAVDASRKSHPFAWQLLEMIPYLDLNQLYKRGELETVTIMRELGRYIAKWQSFTSSGFGFFNSDTLREERRLVGMVPSYRDYYMLNLDKHLHYLVDNGFFDKEVVAKIVSIVRENEELLNLEEGVLVHKDIALWNVLGHSFTIHSIIDWDDTILGDPTDDLSLMGCFHSNIEMRALFEGYMEVRDLPSQFDRRFWLHLLRNMIFKAVIRVGGGYFNKNDSFFLINSNGSGESLLQTTRSRIFSAIDGLYNDNKVFEYETR